MKSKGFTDVRHDRGEQTVQTAGGEVFEFFLVVTPGLESIAAWELEQWLPGCEARVERGGLTLQLPLATGFSLNRKLKVPTRILIRLAEFPCREFPKLFRKVSTFPWEEWVQEPVEFSASSHRSRLRIKRGIEETCRDAFCARFKKKGLALKEPVDVEDAVCALVRFNEDLCTVSLDTSGKLLHKRGFKDFTTEAPIRETMAAAVLLLLEKTALELGLSFPVEFMDPMCGSGTFLIEGVNLERSLHKRPFAFERFVKASEAEKEPEVRRRTPLFSSLIGFEADSKASVVAEKNLSVLGHGVSVVTQDIFKAGELEPETRRWVATNPPYGERLKIRGPLAKYYEELFEAVERVVRPELAAFVLPLKVGPERLRVPRNWRVVTSVRFSNGGIPVAACVFHRR